MIRHSSTFLGIQHLHSVLYWDKLRVIFIFEINILHLNKKKNEWYKWGRHAWTATLSVWVPDNQQSGSDENSTDTDSEEDEPDINPHRIGNTAW